MRTFAAAITLGAASAIDVDVMSLKYMNYMAKFGKNMEDLGEFSKRLSNFSKLDKFIEEENAQGHSFTLGHNQFSDWSKTEYSNMLGYKAEPLPEDQHFETFDESSNGDNVNWIKAGAVTNIKDQGNCGSCWAFSTTGAMEGINFINFGWIVPFSEQQLVSCSKSNHACSGGGAYRAFEYYKSSKVVFESVYPYTSGNGQVAACAYDEGWATQIKVNGISFVEPNNVSQLKAALAKQPIAVAIDAGQSVFQSYASGILDSASCGTSLNHGVLLVGWGYDDYLGKDFWLVKNSWSTNWGDNGYFRLGIQEGKGICGIQMQPITVSSYDSSAFD